MRVLLHLQSTMGKLTGIGHYTAQLRRCLDEQAPGEIIGSIPAVLQDLYARLDWTADNTPGGLFARWGNRTRAGVARLMRGVMKGTQHLRLKLGRFDVYHEPNYIPAPSSVPTVTTILDLSVPLHPEWHPAERVKWFERHFPAVTQRCVHFFAISEAARQEIIGTLGISPSRITRTYMGVRPWLRPMTAAEAAPVLRRLELPPRYLLCLGTIEPRKNVLMLLRAYCDLPAPLRQRCPLVLAGGWGWKAEEVAAFFHEQARHQGVLHLGYVGENDLGAVYNGARALVFPSLYEGFGLPPVEMLACGGAVLASTAAAVAEVAGGQAHLIEPHDTEGWRDGMRRAIEDDGWHGQLCRGAVEHARPFTWDACARDTLRVYRSLAGGQYDLGSHDAVERAA